MSLFPDDDHEAELSEINTTPLIDVMLVLLVMLIITIPLQTHAVHLDLPTAAPAVAEPPPAVQIVVDAAGIITYDGQPIALGSALDQRFQQVGQSDAPPEIHVRADDNAPYGTVAAIMACAQRHAVRKFGLQ